MTLVDGVIILALLGAGIAGWRVGGAVAGGFVVGFGGGLALGTAAAPLVTGPLGEAPGFVVVVLLAFGGATALALGGYHLGVTVRSWLWQTAPLTADRAVGSVVAVVAATGLMWLAGSTLAAGPVVALSSSINGSAVLRAVDRVLPPAPPLIIGVGQHLSDRSGPSLFSGFEPPRPDPVEPAELPDRAQVAAASNAGRDATVQVIAEGCPGGSAGSGVAVDDRLVVTNAHVIAGSASTTVVDGGVDRLATPLLYDAELDVAVLRVSGLTAPALPLAAEARQRGAVAAALGYPQPDRDYTASAAVVLDRLIARGYDLYNRRVVDRQIYRLNATVRPGGSGGPLVTPEGTVIGLMFGRGGNHRGIGYALTTPAVRERVQTARQASEPASTGSCLP